MIQNQVDQKNAFALPIDNFIIILNLIFNYHINTYRD